MSHSTSLLNAKSEFDGFLFAPIGEDKKGTVVTVLTAFARLDFDPWKQAADFARLPKDAATTKLTSMIATLPGMSPDRLEPGTVAARLVALLPGSTSPATSSGGTWQGLGRLADHTSPAYLLWLAIFMALGFASQLFIASLQSQQGNSAPTQSSRAEDARTLVVENTAPATASTAGTLTTDEQMRRDRIDLRNGNGLEQGAGLTTKPVSTVSPGRSPLFGK